MKYLPKNALVVLVLSLLSLDLFAQVPLTKQAFSSDYRSLIIFFDGLRPDYITEETMPNLYAFKKQHAYGTQHHSVFPTVTRVNASSYSTGSYPGTHGLMGNTVYFPEVDATKGLNTGDVEDLNKINKATNGHLLTCTSLGEVLKNVGAEMMVFSSGSTGQAMMQNHTLAGPIINPGFIFPDSIKQKVITEIGALPPTTKGTAQKHVWITDALLKYGITMNGPLVSAIWFSDPDGMAHSDGIGSPTAMQSIKVVDEQFGRIINDLKQKNLDQKFNIIISTDHGFVTYVGKDGIAEFLIEKGLKKDKYSDDVVVVEGAIYVKNHNKTIIKNIVEALQAKDWIGAIFTKGATKGALRGNVAGTFSFETIHWDHKRSGDILVDRNWDDRKNAAGYAGTSFSKGVAGHGGLSPYEVNIPLIVAGPSFLKSTEVNMPTANVDIVPTILFLHKIKIPVSMDGRVMNDFLVKPSKAVMVKPSTETITTTHKLPDGKTYELSLNRTQSGKYFYVNYSKVKRS
ncbi:MAG: alkaline phosphatase family protein [Ferruginibacter sp.]|nr:alkaline phosphatase family protein [Ferruginibacter sp.]